jgi:hypothetical protein
MLGQFATRIRNRHLAACHPAPFTEFSRIFSPCRVQLQQSNKRCVSGGYESYASGKERREEREGSTLLEFVTTQRTPGDPEETIDNQWFIFAPLVS